MHAAEAERSRLIGAVQKMLSRAGKDDGARLPALAGDLLGHVSPEDLARVSPDDLCGFVRSADSLLARRKPGQAVVRLTDPDGDGAGPDGEVTVIEMLNDDMPFLVDSTLQELQALGLTVRLVAHPVVTVTRDRAGKLTAYGAEAQASGRGRRESLIQIVIARVARTADRETIAAQLESLLVEIRHATADWPAMVEKLAAIIASYKAEPPPIPAADVAEAIAFLEWLADDNFTFLGVREYGFSGGAKRGQLNREEGSGLGILADPDVRVLSRGGRGVTMTPAIREFLARPFPLFVAKSNLKSRIHRRAYADYIGIKCYRSDGRLAGEVRFIGLFTSTAYNRSVLAIPYLRRKAEAIVARAGFGGAGHSAKTLVNVLESYPRDELFQTDEDTLFRFVMAIMALAERPRVRVLARTDKFDRFVSVLVFVPRDQYDTDARERIGAYLAETFDGHVSAYYPTFFEGALTRVQFIIGRAGGETPDPGEPALEAAVTRIVESWPDALAAALRRRFEPARADVLAGHYRDAFPVGYRHATSPEAAVNDIATFARLTGEHPIAGSFHRDSWTPPHGLALKLIHLGEPIALSMRVPMLENMGLRVIDEQTYEITPTGDRPRIFVHEMALERADGKPVDLETAAEPLIACFMAVWYGLAENDGYNALVVNGGLGWRDVTILRAVSRYIRQAGTPLTQHTLWETLNAHADIARTLVELFHARFDPDNRDERVAGRRVARIETALEKVESLDEDRAIRRFLNVIDAILRTNVYQRDAEGEPRRQIVFKLDSQRIEDLPAPRPFREIFVYGPRVEGIHLRFGRVARGGIRWSDRPLDFRTEVLGLAKAQQAKNAVIVPVGAKGGFVPKLLPASGDRAAIFEEGKAAYSIFISSLLDITDNLVDDAPVPPDDVIRRDEDDPYLVVAADKGTATFSDTANAIAEAHDFWLGDAFASGGSHGYDHKKMGITARGAWEAVKRHFREMDTDIQATPFTVVGVGDMSGDVFGNAMLLSPQIRLVAAFDHRDIFIDPDPDPAVGIAERQRLFDLPRSSWQDYDRAKISAGGGVFSRKEKSIPLSPEMRAALDLTGEKATPNVILRAILGARADLLFFGGIGTFVRARDEGPDKVGDRANDAIRLTGGEVRARVVGEGGNLAMTQSGRIEYCLAGGRCNSDAIDNSAGVNTSDVEVNIKIALGKAVRDGRLDARGRDKLLASMTDEVAALVLRNNYRQTLAISLTEMRGFAYFGYQRRLIQDLERRGVLDRAVESLPDEVAMAERQAAGKPLTRPEIAVLVAYAKILLFDQLMAGDVADDTTLDDELFRYFPTRMWDDYHADIESHRLRAEIIATMVANSMVNRAGPTYAIRVADRTGASPIQIARVYVVLREAFRLRELNDAIDALDNRIDGTTQLNLYSAVKHLAVSRTTWFLRNVSLDAGIGPVASAFGETIATMAGMLDRVLPEPVAARLADSIEAYRAAGVPEEVAVAIGRLPVLVDATDIHLVAEATGQSLEAAATVFYDVGERARIGNAMRRAEAIPMTDYYDGLARERALETIATAHRQIAIQVIKAGGVEAWRAARSDAVERSLDVVSGITETEEMTLSRIAVVASLLADLAAI
ncbi:NAD-glutamate dehydrogenase [Bauldia litoralis]|uniref:Glutamate dehydrogenase (NAD) n=1 Tax=Bauldia litoralis TaxID=665467 RepID=A0A1G6BYJ3_9HYPH|nr:NAD-glutamate dehydrogenase [Bauldia litoralis]SDB25695.1 glutamate dehydrogenase (NAD) [Bauldia litoralis]